MSLSWLRRVASFELHLPCIDHSYKLSKWSLFPAKSYWDSLLFAGKSSSSNAYQLERFIGTGRSTPISWLLTRWLKSNRWCATDEHRVLKLSQKFIIIKEEGNRSCVNTNEHDWRADWMPSCETRIRLGQSEMHLRDCHRWESLLPKCTADIMTELKRSWQNGGSDVSQQSSACTCQNLSLIKNEAGSETKEELQLAVWRRCFCSATFSRLCSSWGTVA